MSDTAVDDVVNTSFYLFFERLERSLVPVIYGHKGYMDKKVKAELIVHCGINQVNFSTHEQ